MLTEKQLNRLYRYGVSLTADEALSYDLLQDALEGYLRLHAPLVSTSGVEPYLRKAIRNRYIDQIRYQKRHPGESLHDQADSLVSLSMPDPGDVCINRQLLETILQRLSSQERELLYLWAYQELTAQEIATQLDKPRGTVLSQIHRLRQKIGSFDLEKPISSRGSQS